MHELLKILILAAVQGCAEFLPISSSGHLAILSNLMDVQSNVLTLTIVLHAGTLLAILVYYFKFLLSLIKKKDYRLLMLVVVSTIPTVVIGMLLRKSELDELLFNNLIFPGVGLIVTGIILLNGLKGSGSNDIEVHSMTIKKALAIGVAQGLAIFPGISRSGSTISAALKLGIRSEDAATFSFMLAIPVIAGASLLELISGVEHNSADLSAIRLEHLTLGFIVSAVVGFYSLKLLISTLKKNKLTGYAYYCITVGTLVIMWTLLK